MSMQSDHIMEEKMYIKKNLYSVKELLVYIKFIALPN